jgi:uncharacterized protein (DUF2236 family)
MDVVTVQMLEHRLAALAATAPGECEGAFGPDSTRWRIDREAALFLGAGRALRLQLAHPWVVAAVAQHSRALDNRIARFHGTFATVFAMVFGRLGEALAAARALHRRHAAIVGLLPETAAAAPEFKGFAANDRAALCWVHATLVETALKADALVQPLTAEARDRYYTESRRFSGFFGLGLDEIPADFGSFSGYCAAMVNGGALEVGPRARDIAARLMGGAGQPIGVPAWYRALTAELLPAPLAEAYGLSLGARERRLSAGAVRVLRLAYPRLPARLCFVGPYHEARERLLGRRPGLRTRLANRVWIGRPAMGA